MPSGFATAFASIQSFTATSWVYAKTLDNNFRLFDIGDDSSEWCIHTQTAYESLHWIYVPRLWGVLHTSFRLLG